MLGKQILWLFGPPTWAYFKYDPNQVNIEKFEVAAFD